MRAFTHPTRDSGRKLPRALQTIQIIPISFSGLPRKLRILPVFEHFDQPPVEKQSQSEPASGGARAFGDDHASRQRGLRPNPVLTPPADVLKWSIGIPFIVVSAVACVIGVLFSYEETLHDSVLRPPSSLASRGGPLPSVKSTRIEFAMVDDGPAAAYSLRPASPSEKPTESQRPPRSTCAAVLAALRLFFIAHAWG